MEHYRTSVLVLGGGPAGGAAALELAQVGCDVMLLERQKIPGWKIGETLPPEARVHLQRLNHWDAFQHCAHRPCYGIVSCWGRAGPIEQDFIANPYGHGWQLDRAKFELGLIEAANNAGCQTFFGAEVTSIDYQLNQWRLKTSSQEFRAQWLLDCTGRNGVLASLGKGGTFRQLQKFVSVYCLLDASKETDKDGRTYVESHPTGWAYSALMPSGSRIVAFLTDGDLIPEETSMATWMKERISECPTLNVLLKSKGYAPIKSVQVRSAASGRYERLCGQDWILVGDAGMTFDPLSGWGSIKAIVSAAAAVQMVLNGTDYQAAKEELWQSYLVQYRDYYLSEQRWPTAPFWSRRHQKVLN